jgi:HEAT repeat protein
MRLFAAALVLAAFASAAPADDTNPEFNGKTLSEWTTTLRESQSARLRKVSVVAVGQIAADHQEKTKMVKEIMTAVGKAMRNDSAVAVRAEAARVLGKAAIQLMDDRTADVGSVVIDLSEGLRLEKEAEAKLEEATALGRYGKLAKPAVQTLAAAAADKDAKVQAAAATSLGRIGPDAKTVDGDLLPLLKSPDAAVRKAAAFALGRIEPDDVVKASAALVPLLKSEKDADLRAEVVTSLGMIGDKSQDTVKAVGAALADESVDVRRLAAQALAKFFVGAKAAAKELQAAFQADADKLVRAYALRALCVGLADDAKQLIPVLTARLDPVAEKEPEVRIAVCDELGGLGPDGQPAVPALRTAQKDPNTKVRDAAAAAIKKVTAKPAPKADK